MYLFDSEAILAFGRHPKTYKSRCLANYVICMLMISEVHERLHYHSFIEADGIILLS
jgi:hypothetical protein